MSLIINRKPVWLESFPQGVGNANESLLLGGDDCEVSVPSALLLAASPLVRRMLINLPAVLSPEVISIPSSSGSVLRDVREMLTRGTADMNRERIGEVQEVLRLMEVEAILVWGNEKHYMEQAVLEDTINTKDAIIKKENFNSDTNEDYSRTIKGTSKSNFIEEDHFELKFELSDANAKGNLDELISDESFSCGECEYKTWVADDLNKHNKEHLDEDMVSLKALKTRIKRQEGTCSICFKVFMNSGKLSRHKKTVHAIKKDFKCTYCDFKCSQNDNLKQHIKLVHVGEKKEVCEECGRKFGLKATLRDHRTNVHGIGEVKLLECPKCFGSYKSKSRLQRHIKFVHDQVKPFGCDVCEMSFPDQSKLKRHFIGRCHKSKSMFVL